MKHPENFTIGERVAWFRRRRGMPQEILAGLVGRTVDWLSKIENGRAELDRLSVIRLLAHALDVPVGDLIGQDSARSNHASPKTEAISRLKGALLEYHQLPVAHDAPTSTSAGPAALKRSVARVWSTYQECRYESVLAHLPPLLREAHFLTQTGPDHAQHKAHECLALTYQVAAALLSKLGETHLSWIAAERGFHFAQQAGNPAMVGSLFRSITHALCSTGRYKEAKSLAVKGASYLQPELGSASPQLLSTYGALFLCGSVAAARDNDRQTVHGFLDEAAEAARRLGNDANYLWTAFGPSNVEIHRVATAMELGDIQLALDLGPRVDTRHLPLERQVRHAMEISRAYSAWNQTDQALEALLKAETLAPEQVRRHVISRQLVQVWIHRGKRKPSFQLADLARRIHAYD